MRGKDVLFSHKSDEWCTPIEIIKKIQHRCVLIVDLAANESNAVCRNYSSALTPVYLKNIECHFSGKDELNLAAFCNPPYSCWQSFVKMIAESNIPCVMLLPARTDTKAFHEYIYNKKGVEIEFIKGRLKFSDSKNSAPFPSMLVYFRC